MIITKYLQQRRKQIFNLSLLNDPKYTYWLVATGDSNSIRCKFCNKNFTFGNMSKGALESHKRGKKYQKLELLLIQAGINNGWTGDLY